MLRNAIEWKTLLLRGPVWTALACYTVWFWVKVAGLLG